VTAADPLVDALIGLQRSVEAVRLPIDVPAADAARALQRATLDQLSDYVLPRLSRLDAPLLAVVGGSTGSGKSTLVNSLVGSTVSPAGVLRPTTRAPVLVHHPDDAAWFDPHGPGTTILPTLPRVSGDQPASAEGRALRLVPRASLPPGLALLDAPDIDSVVTENRLLAAELLAAADLWLFVTSAARYADAVPWGFLRTAARRSAAVAVVLDRVPPAAVAEVRLDLARMLSDHDLGSSPLFVVTESALRDGLLPSAAFGEIQRWLRGLAADAAARAAVVRHTLDGAVDDLARQAPVLADAADEQLAAVGRLAAAAEHAYASALDDVERGTSDGTMLRGEVLARWQDFVGTGDLFRTLESKVGHWRDRIGAAFRGTPPAEPEVETAIESSLEALVLDGAARAADRAYAAWRADPAGAALLGGLQLSRASDDLAPRVTAEIRGWQGAVLDLVAGQGAGKRSTARRLSFGVNALGVSLMLVVFASTGGVTGGEIGIAGGTAVVAQRVLEAVFGDDAVRALAREAHADLLRRVAGLYAAERARFDSVLDGLALPPGGGTDVRAAAAAVAAAARAERAERAALPPPAPDDGSAHPPDEAATPSSRPARAWTRWRRGRRPSVPPLYPSEGA
jgi:hypothetical protein